MCEVVYLIHTINEVSRPSARLVVAMADPKPEMPYRPEFDTKITVGVPEFIKAISNGNEQKAPPFLPFETAVAMYEDVIAEASKPERQEQLKAIDANAEFNAVRKAHKRELVFSEICLAALKKHGFTSGVDVKKTLRHFNQTKDLEEDTEKQAKYVELEKKLGALTEPPTPAAAETGA